MKASAIIYVKASPAIAMARIKERKRGEEAHVDEAYIQVLHEAHESWLGGQEAGFRSSQAKISKIGDIAPVVYLNAELPLSEMPAEYERCLKELHIRLEASGMTGLTGQTALGPHVIRFQKLSEYAKIPVRGSQGAAGLDLFSAEQATIPANGRKIIRTDLAVELPAGCYGRIAPRSGLAVNHGLNVGAGVVDPDFIGGLMVVIFNHSPEDYEGLLGHLCEMLY